MKKAFLCIFNLFTIITSIFAIDFKLPLKFGKNENHTIKLTREEKSRIGEIEFYKHNQILKLIYEDQKINIHSKPFSFMSDDIFFIAKYGDELKVIEVLYSPKINSSCLFVIIPSGKSGYIPLYKNPYKKGQFTFKEELVVNDSSVKVLSLQRQYTFEGFSKDPAIIQTQPTFDSDVIAKIYEGIRLETKAITADYKWLYVTYENQEGWINTRYLCDGIGGPVLNTPKEMIGEDLFRGKYR